MSKRNTIIFAVLLIVSAISIDILEGIGYKLLSQHYERFVPGALFGAGFSALILAFVNKNKKIE